MIFSLWILGCDKFVVCCYLFLDGFNCDFYWVSIKKIGFFGNVFDVFFGIGSIYFYENINEGDIVDVCVFSGKFYLVMEEMWFVVFIVGGVGIILFIFMFLVVIDVVLICECWFFYGVWNGSELMKWEWLWGLNYEYFNLNVVLCYSDVYDYEMEGWDFDYCGYVILDFF